MQITATAIADVLLFEPTRHGDERGYFMETFRLSHFQERGLDYQFVQDNQSKSRRGILRGLHYQLNQPQGKLLRVVSGEIFDVAVDLRQSSASFGKWVGETLSAENGKQLWVPPGFAHGFLVLSDSAEITYKCTDYYNPADEHSLLWNDPAVGIDWPDAGSDVVLSDKDRAGKSLADSALFP